MEKYEVKLSPAAHRDFLGVAEHLDTLPPEEALPVYDHILTESEVLQNAPATCPYARDSQLRLRGYRVLVINEYIFFFVICGYIVNIRRILYAKKRYERFV